MMRLIELEKNGNVIIGIFIKCDFYDTEVE